MKKMRGLFALLLTFVMLMSLTAGAFADGSNWYDEAVSYVKDQGIMTGTSQDDFNPNGIVDRATVFQTFYNLAGQPEAEGDNFTDVKEGDWFASAALWAKSAGLAKGSDIGFEGSRAINRTEMAMVFYNFFTLEEITCGSSDISSFADSSDAPEWGLDALKAMFSCALMSGKGDSTLDPLGTATRAELAQMHMTLSRLLSDEAAGKVAVVDKYGNITLDIYTKTLKNAGYAFGDMLTVSVAGQEFEIPFCTNYSDVDTGSLVVRAPGGTDAARVIIAINMGNFAGTYGAEVGDEVVIGLKEAGAYFNEWELRQLSRTNNREDYASDEIFANFREVTAGGIASGVLYRSSSPVNNELGRAAYSDDLIESAGVMTVINLADSAEDIEGYIAQDDFDSPYYKSLCEDGGVITLSMGVDFSSDDFKSKLRDGLMFMTEGEGPYLIHCTEGKDRAGYIVAILEALMGAGADEILGDYMTTYINYYKVEKGSEQYDRIGDSNILESMRSIAGLEKGASLEGVDLAGAANGYLLGIGLTQTQINSLKDILAAPASASAAA